MIRKNSFGVINIFPFFFTSVVTIVIVSIVVKATQQSPQSSSSSQSPQSSSSSQSSSNYPSSCIEALSINNACTNTIGLIPVPNGIDGIKECIDFTGVYPGIPQVYLGITQYKSYESVVYNTVDNTPNYLEVMQGGLGNCVFDASIAQIAYKHPEMIKNIIFNDTEPGIYYIKFYNYINNFFFLVKITDEFPIDQDWEGAFDKFYYDPEIPEKKVIWSHLILKAFACIIGYYQDIQLVRGNTLQGYNGITSQVYGASCLNFLTGYNNTKIFNNNFSNYFTKFNSTSYLFLAGAKNTSDFVNIQSYDSLSNKYIFSDGTYLQLINALLGVYKKDNNNCFLIFDSDGNVIDAIINSHCYSVLGYTPGIVNLRNPWGTYAVTIDNIEYGYTDGLIELQINHFNLIYGVLYYLAL